MSKAEDNSKNDARKAQILLVDDDSDVRMMVKVILKREGFSGVEEATNADQGLRRLERRNIDLVLLDWNMPGLPGIELLRVVRSWNYEIPIIMLTAQSTSDRVNEAITSGVTDYIVKPFTSAGLVRKIERTLAGFAAGKEKK